MESQNKISFHIKRSHGLKMTEYNAMYGSSLVSRSWHTCQICGISILCDYFSIYQHLTKAHRVSLQDSASNRSIGEVVQSRRRPLQGPSPG